MQITHEIDEHFEKVRVGEFDALVWSSKISTTQKTTRASHDSHVHLGDFAVVNLWEVHPPVERRQRCAMIQQ